MQVRKELMTSALSNSISIYIVCHNPHSGCCFVRKPEPLVVLVHRIIIPHCYNSSSLCLCHGLYKMRAVGWWWTLPGTHESR